MVTVKIKENSKQSKAVIEMLKTFDFVKFEEEKKITTSGTLNLSKQIKKSGTKKAFNQLGLNYDSYSR